MAEIKSKTVNAGDPVTADIINNLIVDLNELNKSTAASFKLSLDNQTASKSSAAAVSQKVYSTIKSKFIEDGGVKTITWEFSTDNIKFNSAPRCWVQVQNTNTSLPYTAFNFNIVITAVSMKSMTFQIRGKGFTKATHEFICFAADA